MVQGVQTDYLQRQAEGLFRMSSVRSKTCVISHGVSGWCLESSSVRVFFFSC